MIIGYIVFMNKLNLSPACIEYLKIVSKWATCFINRKRHPINSRRFKKWNNAAHKQRKLSDRYIEQITPDDRAKLRGYWRDSILGVE
jgi:hypothetical protein